MTSSTFQRALSVLTQLGISDIRFTGGEPTIHPEFQQLVKIAHEQGFQVGLVSNGWAISKNWWNQEFLSQLSRCWISLYGVTPDSHAAVAGRRRSEAEFQSILQAVGNMSKDSPRIGIGVSLTPKSTSGVREFLNRAKSFGIRRVRFLPLQMTGRAVSEFSVDTAFRSEMLALFREMRQWNEIDDFVSVSLNNMHNLDSTKDVGMKTCLLGGRRMPSIVPNGDVYRCCYNAYSTPDLLCNISDFDQCISALSEPQPPNSCQAFEQQDPTWICQSCPISKVSIESIA